MSEQNDVQMHWDVKIAMRDGVQLSATVYLPQGHSKPTPALFTLTPYIAQTYHEVGMDFAAHGYPFLTVDVRGRGNSEGHFRPMIQEAQDGYDIVEWLARQSYCNGQVAMWGGSYAGLDQWNTARERPPHLATIVPTASPYIAEDYPIRGNIPSPYLMQWLTLVSGRTSQDKMFWNNELYWGKRFAQWFESGLPFNELDSFLGNPSATFREWVSHPRQDAYWDQHNPTAEQYAKLSIPILTITGSYDGDQPGALKHYREHLKNAPAAIRARHYLIIGPWDHAGTRTPQAEFVGLKVGPASLVDMSKLHRQWYAWTMQDGPKPEFLKKSVAYYVMGANRWRYTDTLEAITARSQPWYLHATHNPDDVFHSGALTTEPPVASDPDHYVYDPRDVSHAAIESLVDPESRADQRMVHAMVGKRLVYHSAPFEQDTEISGFFKLSAWLSIDQPDTDFGVWVYDIQADATSVLLTSDGLRARYREGLREEKLIRSTEPLEYHFDGFMFISRLIKKGNRLRVVFGPLNSIYWQKNYNSGGVVAEESMQDARTVNVKLFHDPSRPTVLHVPLGQP
jgi:putative CocE/NonD family hydrolase